MASTATSFGNAYQLDATPSGGTKVTLTQVYNYRANDGHALVTRIEGSARVETFFGGARTEEMIEVEVRAAAAPALWKKGDYFSAVELYVDTALDAEGTAIGGKSKLVFGQCVLAEKSEIGLGSDDKNVATITLTFRPARKPGDSTDPAIPEWADVGS